MKNLKIFIILGIVMAILIGIIIYFIIQTNQSKQEVEEVKSLSPNIYLLDQKVNELKQSNDLLTEDPQKTSNNFRDR